MGQTTKSFGSLVKRYAPVVFFPTFTITTIYADYRHTQLWKKSLREANQSNLASA